MTFHVELLPTAERDLERILGWLNDRSPQGASAWHRRWMKVLEDLEMRPNAYAPAPEDSRHELELRQVIFKTKQGKPYRAIFTVIERTVFVFCIRGHGQDLLDPNTLTLPQA
jgi:plasmid stabilization system protein ParE